MKWLLSISILCFYLQGHTQEPHSIELVSWNVFLRPGFMPDNQMGRVDSISAYLNNSNADVLILQELFHFRARHRLIKTLSVRYPYHSNVGKSSFLGVSSGVMIFSKTEIIREKHVYFKRAIKADQLAKKGGVLAVILINEKPIEIIGTHLQAGGEEKGIEIRKTQIEQLKSLPSNKNQPTIFAGDFNISSGSDAYLELLIALKCMNKKPSGSLQNTANFSDHNLMKTTGKPNWIDFILTSKKDKIQSLLSRIEQPMFLKNGKRKRLSDHNPIFSTIDLGEVSPALH